MDEIVAAKDGEVIDLPQTERALDITVLMGGPSSEREVSLQEQGQSEQGCART